MLYSYSIPTAGRWVGSSRQLQLAARGKGPRGLLPEAQRDNYSSSLVAVRRIVAEERRLPFADPLSDPPRTLLGPSSDASA